MFLTLQKSHGFEAGDGVKNILIFRGSIQAIKLTNKIVIWVFYYTKKR